MNVATIQLANGAGSQIPSRIIIHAMGEFIDTEPND